MQEGEISENTIVKSRKLRDTGFLCKQIKDLQLPVSVLPYEHDALLLFHSKNLTVERQTAITLIKPHCLSQLR